MRRVLRLLAVGSLVLVPVVAAFASVDMSASPSSLAFGSPCTHSTATTKQLVVTNNGSTSASNVAVSVSPSPMASVFQLGGQKAASRLDPGASRQLHVGHS